MDNVVDCLSRVSQALDARGIGSGAISHTIAQLQNAFEQASQGLTFKLEKAIQTTVTSRTGVTIDVDRVIDVVSRGIEGRIHTEIKTGQNLGAALDMNQLTQDAAIAIKRGARESLENIWQFTNIKFNEQNIPVLQQRIEKLANDMLSKGFSETQVKRAIESFQFEDKVGNAFKPAIEFTFDKSGPIAKVALAEASGSPDFHPAMETLFGPSGKIADAAHHAATGANLDPALNNLEQKLETGVNSALDEAGKKSAEHAGKALAEKITSGITSLGNVMTSIPALYDSVTKLGEVWHKPLNSTKDYMDLLSAAGGTVTQVGSTIQAFAGITQIASAAQAVFNAIAAANPYVLIVIAVIALIAAIALLIIYWDQVRAFLRDNPWISVIIAMTGIIGLIIVIIAYWDEIKLAALQAANFISIQIQKIGFFFVGLKNLAGMVWDWMVATVANVGISILNTFIAIGVGIQNFFIGIINWVLEKYNALADSVVGDVLGLFKAELIPEVPLETKLIPPKEVPTVSIEAAFATGPVTGGLEGQIAKQEEVLKKTREEDEKRRKEVAEKRAAEQQAAQQSGGASAPGLPGLSGTPTPGFIGPPAASSSMGSSLTPGIPGSPLGRPSLPATAMAGAAGPVGGADQSVHVGTITVNINAEKLEANAAKLLSDEIVSQLKAKLDALRTEQDFRIGMRPA